MCRSVESGPAESPDTYLSTVHPDAAGIDIGSTFHVVAVPPERDSKAI
ncbi:MAG TPA: hypothetical protein VMS04_00685 [Vicinamibacterales bacterium]|nr:hypothetical protein [Vicinamibacterales bacterium]